MIEYLAETGSTNADVAVRLSAGERMNEGDWLVADRQTAGQGRQGRNWSDGTGNFMGSTLVHLSPSDPSPPTLSLLAGLALHECVGALLPIPDLLRLKWPNDVMLSGAKISGILLERVGDAVIVGIGVNLAMAPSLPDKKTAALADFIVQPDRNIFAESLCAQFTQELERWRTTGLEPILRRWRNAAFDEGTAMSVHEPDGTILNGGFAGISNDGSLRLRLVDGTVRAIHAGDVMLA